MRSGLLFLAAALLCPAQQPEYDVVLRHGLLYDGSGKPPVPGDLAIRADRIAALGDLSHAKGRVEIDVHGQAIAPGFVNMLSQAMETLLVDGLGQSDLRQGVTLEIFGEGDSMGPLNAALKKDALAQQGDLKYAMPWNTLAEYLEYAAKRGITPNIASFVGATSVRQYVLGNADRPPNAAELEQMRMLVRNAMRDGALGVGSALIYAPAFYAKTDELVALCEEAAHYGGMYISHIRSEGNAILPAVDELISISRRAGLPAEIYHLKLGGQPNWSKLPQVLAKIEKARTEGLRITANMYTYPAGQTGLDAAMPPWVQEGGLEEWRKRLRDPVIREKVRREMTTPTDRWENLMLGAGSPEKVLLVGFKSEALKPLTGKTLAEVAHMRNRSPEDTAMDLVVEDDSRIETVYFLMSEENIRKQIALPWVSFGSDAGSQAPEGVFLKSSTHPRAYGNFARLLGKYVRDEKVIPLEEAIRRLTALPTANMHIAERGLLKENYFADVVVFDPAKIQDRATFDQPQQFAQGVTHVFVNGVHTLKEGVPTGNKAGRALKRAPVANRR